MSATRPEDRGHDDAKRPRYDSIGVGYARTRREDPTFCARIWGALADARSVVNVTYDANVSGEMWLMADYLVEVAELDRRIFPSPETVLDWLGGEGRVEVLPRVTSGMAAGTTSTDICAASRSTTSASDS